MKDESIMLLTAFASFACAGWAYFVPARGVMLALVLNALISLIFAYRIDEAFDLKKIVDLNYLPFVVIVIGLFILAFMDNIYIAVPFLVLGLSMIAEKICPEKWEI